MIERRRLYILNVYGDGHGERHCASLATAKAVARRNAGHPLEWTFTAPGTWAATDGCCERHGLDLYNISSVTLYVGTEEA